MRVVVVLTPLLLTNEEIINLSESLDANLEQNWQEELPVTEQRCLSILYTTPKVKKFRLKLS